MKNIPIWRDVRQRGPDVEAAIADDSNACFTPGDFFHEAGTIIVVCLGLGLLMRVLLG